MDLDNKSLGEICLVCSEIKEKGMHLFTSFICKDCERELVNTETDDERYKFFIEKLRKVMDQQIYS